jgi:hypothetical protein
MSASLSSGGILQMPFVTIIGYYCVNDVPYRNHDLCDYDRRTTGQPPACSRRDRWMNAVVKETKRPVKMKDCRNTEMLCTRTSFIRGGTGRSSCPSPHEPVPSERVGDTRSTHPMVLRPWLQRFRRRGSVWLWVAVRALHPSAERFGLLLAMCRDRPRTDRTEISCRARLRSDFRSRFPARQTEINSVRCDHSRRASKLAPRVSRG